MTADQVLNMILTIINENDPPEGKVKILAVLRELVRSTRVDEQIAILSLVRTWTGNTVEGMDLISVIEMRAKRQ